MLRLGRGLSQPRDADVGEFLLERSIRHCIRNELVQVLESVGVLAPDLVLCGTSNLDEVLYSFDRPSIELRLVREILIDDLDCGCVRQFVQQRSFIKTVRPQVDRVGCSVVLANLIEHHVFVEHDVDVEVVNTLECIGKRFVDLTRAPISFFSAREDAFRPAFFLAGLVSAKRVSFRYLARSTTKIPKHRFDITRQQLAENFIREDRSLTGRLSFPSAFSGANYLVLDLGLSRLQGFAPLLLCLLRLNLLADSAKR